MQSVGRFFQLPHKALVVSFLQLYEYLSSLRMFQMSDVYVVKETV